MQIKNHTKSFLIELEEKIRLKHTEYIAQSLTLDLTRGKPAPEQLELSNEIDGILQNNYIAQGNVDTRNYGQQQGILEARKLGSEWLGLDVEQIIASDHSSLTLMYHVLHIGAHYGYDNCVPWLKQKDPVFLAVVPGYDRHFGIAEKLNIKMINVPLLDSGPDMDIIENIAQEKNLKGIFCVPKFSNPTGTVYDDTTVKRLAKLGQVTDNDFRIIWDNAYAVHDLYEYQAIPNIMNYCVEYNTVDSVVLLGSTSKVTHAGSGISFLGASEKNIKEILAHLDIFRICPNKVNQLRHTKFLPNMKSVHSLMQKHAQIIRPKFDIVNEILYNNLYGKGIGTWSDPKGGYFVSFESLPGLAKKIVSLSAEAGVKLTPAGATFPYGNDPNDSNIRLSPTFPSIEDLKLAMQIFVNSVYLASLQYYIEKKE